MNGENPSTSVIKFQHSFTQEAEKYLANCKKNKKIPNLDEFAEKLGTDKASVLAWANKKKKDEKGNVLEELARPNFHAAIQRFTTLAEELSKPKEEKLNPKQEMFCRLYATDEESFGNATSCYLKAYGLDRQKVEDYKNAMSSASDLLRNPKILKRIDDLLEDYGLNDSFVDKQLFFVIRQNYELSAKIAAIREYNKLKQRIIDRSETKHSGTLSVKQVSYKDLT